MKKMNNCEAEIDKIRVKLYEETKHLSKEEHTRQTNERAHKFAAKYGFIMRHTTKNS